MSKHLKFAKHTNISHRFAETAFTLFNTYEPRNTKLLIRSKDKRLHSHQIEMRCWRGIGDDDFEEWNKDSEIMERLNR